MSADPLNIGDGAGCQFVIAFKVLCMKLCDEGQRFCPHHILLMQHNQQQAAKKEDKKLADRQAELRRKARR